MKLRPLAAQGVLICLSALWGSSFLFIRIASPLLGPQVLAGVRVWLAALTLYALMKALGKRWPDRGSPQFFSQWRYAFWVAISAVALPFLLFAWAGLHLPAGYSAVFQTTSVLFGAIIAVAIGLDTIPMRKVIGCVVSFAGLVSLIRLGPIELSPLVLLACGAALLAGLCYAVAGTINKIALFDMEPLVLATMTHVIAAIMLAPLTVAFWDSANWSWRVFAIVTLLGVVTSGLAYWLSLIIVQQLRPSQAMFPPFLIPMFGVMWGAVYLDERVSLGMLAGMLLALLGVALLTELKINTRKESIPPERNQ